MIPKDKAKELVDKFKNRSIELGETNSQLMAEANALIAVDEVKWFHKKLFYLTDGSLFDKYLDDVKQEIEKL